VSEHPPVRLPGHGALLPDGTHIPEPDLFFPLGPGRSPEVERAKEMCGWCHVRQQCLAYALTRDVRGIWGGATEADRQSMRRKARIPAGVAS
jgi:WhiB family redox-sensing transcriptional regulator